MRKSDLLKESLASLRVNKMRTGLTMLGIIIGVAAVVAMISLGEGSKVSIQKNIENLGSNNLIIFPGTIQTGRGFVASGRGSAEIFTKKDIDKLSSVENIVAISPEIQRRFQVISDKGNNQSFTILGVDEDFFIVRKMEIKEGAVITRENVRSYYKVAVLGAQAAKDLFGEDDPLGRKIRINNLNFKVIGVLKEKGSSGFVSYDDLIIIPYSVLQKQLAGTEYFNLIAVKVDKKENIEKAQKEIEETLMLLHKLEDPNFTIFSQEDILNALTSVINIFTIFLSFIAGISLVVGGIGIMNMMLTTVTERIKEIGLKKSLGAKKRDILNQILLEAIVVTLIGGLVGLILGIFLSIIVSSLANITTFISFKAILISISFSTFIGVIFGYYPAKKASELNPIDALRYE